MFLFLFNLIYFTSQTEFCNSTYRADPIKSGYSLIHTTIIFKHGIHAPVDKVPEAEAVWNCSSDNWLFPGGNALNDDVKFTHRFKVKPIQHQSFLLGTCRAGELLEEGIRQMERLSIFLKQTYSSLIPKQFNRRLISFRSTYTNRCLACIQILAHHLFAGSEPIDVFVANEELESLVPNAYLCPSLGDVYSSITKENTTFSKRLINYNEKLDKIKKESKFDAVPTWVRMPEFLVTTKCANVPYPGNFSDNFLNESAELLMSYFNEVSKSENGKKFSSGILLSEIYLGMRDYLAGRSDSQFVLVCGHTLSFTSLFSSLNMSAIWQNYGAYISFDLLQKSDSFLVRVTLNGKTIKSYDLKEFEEHVMKLRPTEEECQIKYPFMEKDKKSQGTKFLSMSFS